MTGEETIVRLRRPVRPSVCEKDMTSPKQSLPAYRSCNSRGQIAALDAWHHEEDAHFKCSTCGMTNWSEEWPDVSIRSILQTVLDEPSDTPHYERVSCLVLAACLEDMMRQQLRLMGAFKSSWEDADFLMSPLLDAYRGRERQLQLYSHIGYGSFKAVCTEVGLADYSAQWHRVTHQRNHFAHTTESPSKSLSPSEIVGFIRDTLTVFSRIYNKYNCDTVGFGAAINPLHPGEIRELIDKIEEIDGKASPPHSSPAAGSGSGEA